MKQIPFRYPDEEEKDVELIKHLQHWGSTKNKSIRLAVKITAGLIRQTVKDINKGKKKKVSLDEYDWDLWNKIRNKIEKLANVETYIR